MKPDFYKSNIERLKSLGQDCAECIRNREMCHHYDYLRDYIKELETLPPVDDEKFKMFWEAYPKKEARKVALKSWQRLKATDELFGKIMIALEKHKLTRQWRDKQYIPLATTWLNQERWEDEIEPPPIDKSSEIRSSELFSTLVSWAENNGAYRMEKTLEGWIMKYGEYSVKSIMRSNENSFHNFMVDMGKMKDQPASSTGNN